MTSFEGPMPTLCFEGRMPTLCFKGRCWLSLSPGPRCIIVEEAAYLSRATFVRLEFASIRQRSSDWMKSSWDDVVPMIPPNSLLGSLITTCKLFRLAAHRLNPLHFRQIHPRHGGSRGLFALQPEISRPGIPCICVSEISVDAVFRKWLIGSRTTQVEMVEMLVQLQGSL